jgi:beta-glucoside operon transcriptional antiterminator
MKVFKSINNNITSAFDDNGREIVVIGKGIGYKAKEGDVIPPEKVDKIFLMSSKDNMERLKELFASLSTEYIEITDEIFEYAKKHLDKRLNESAFLTLADHISFAVTRFKQDMIFQNVLLAEVRRFYGKEFEVGLYATRLMKEKLGIDMPEDEAASIALHILNAEYDISIGEAFHATQLIDKIIEIISQNLGYKINTGDHYCDRMITHLRYMTQRIIRGEPYPETGSESFYDMVLMQYPKETRCAEKVAAMVEQEFRFEMSKDEISSLAIHIKRLKFSE